MLSFYNKRNSHVGLTQFFFLFLSYTFAYLHFYTIIRMMVRASEPSNERECGIHTEKREKEEGERVNIRFLIFI